MTGQQVNAPLSLEETLEAKKGWANGAPKYKDLELPSPEPRVPTDFSAAVEALNKINFR